MQRIYKSTDTLKLKGVTTDQVSLRFIPPVVGESKDLVLDLAGGDQVTVKGFFAANGPAVGKIKRFVSYDGTLCRNKSRCSRNGEKLGATVRNHANAEWKVAA